VQFRIGNTEVQGIRDRCIPIAESDCQSRCGGADLQDVEICSAGVVGIAVRAFEQLCILLCFLAAAFFGAVGDEIGDIVHVVPIVFFRNVLGIHVGAVDTHGIEKTLSGSLVVSDTVKDMAGHVDHVSRSGSERSKSLSALDGPLRMAALDSVNPIMIGGSIVWMLLEDFAEYRLSVER